MAVAGGWLGLFQCGGCSWWAEWINRRETAKLLATGCDDDIMLIAVMKRLDKFLEKNAIMGYKPLWV